MALHTELPIYKKGCDHLRAALATKPQAEQDAAAKDSERIALMSLFNFMRNVFVPMTPQQHEIKKQLDITEATIRAARASNSGGDA